MTINTSAPSTATKTAAIATHCHIGRLPVLLAGSPPDCGACAGGWLGATGSVGGVGAGGVGFCGSIYFMFLSITDLDYIIMPLTFS